MSSILPNGKTQFLDINGRPLVNGKVFYYEPNTETPKTTYADMASTTPNTNPVVLDARGEAVIWGSGTYRQVVQDSDGLQIYDVVTRDLSADIDAAVGDVGQIRTDLADTTDVAKGDALIAVMQPFSGATARTVHDKLAEIIYVTDFVPAVSTGDDTSAIQYCLNTARKIVFTGGRTYNITGCEIPSGTHVVFEPGCVIYMKDGSNRPAFQNVNWQKSTWGGATYGVDHDITIEGLYLNGNQANQIHTGTGIYAGEYTSGFRLFGVTNLKLKDISVYQAKTFGIWLCAIDGLEAENINFNQLMTGTPANQDGLHINGPARRLRIKNVTGNTNDDMIALNADDGALGSNVTAGDITDCVIEGVFPNGSLNGVRLLSMTSRMDGITVRTVHGTTMDVAVNQSPFGGGAGNVGTLTIEDIDVKPGVGYAGGSYYSVITLDGIIENVTIRNVKRNKPADNRPAVRIVSTANIGICDISGITQFSTMTPPANELMVVVSGHVSILKVRDISWFCDPLATRNGAAVLLVDTIASAAGGVDTLVASDWVVQRCRDTIVFGTGVLNNVALSNIQDLNGDVGYSLLNLSSANVASTNVATRGCSTTYGRKIINVTGSSSLLSSSVVDAAGVSGAKAKMAAAQAVTSGSYQKINFTSIAYDRVTGEYLGSGAQFTASQGSGLYMIGYSLQLTIPTNPTSITLALYKNGVLLQHLPGSGPYAGDSIIGGNVLLSVSVGDVLDLRVIVTANVTILQSEDSSVTYERIK